MLKYVRWLSFTKSMHSIKLNEKNPKERKTFKCLWRSACIFWRLTDIFISWKPSYTYKLNWCIYYTLKINIIIYDVHKFHAFACIVLIAFVNKSYRWLVSIKWWSDIYVWFMKLGSLLNIIQLYMKCAHAEKNLWQWKQCFSLSEYMSVLWSLYKEQVIKITGSEIV